jgi:hypothetical protein
MTVKTLAASTIGPLIALGFADHKKVETKAIDRGRSIRLARPGRRSGARLIFYCLRARKLQ